MIVQYGESNSNPNYLISTTTTKKGDISNVTKTAARKSILMQIMSMDLANLVNGFH
jgi:hypothetical protein